MGVAVVVAGAIVALALRRGDEPGRSALPGAIGSSGAIGGPPVGLDGFEEAFSVSADPFPGMDPPQSAIQPEDSEAARRVWREWSDAYEATGSARAEWLTVRGRSPGSVALGKAHDRYLASATSAMGRQIQFYELVGRSLPPRRPQVAAYPGVDPAFVHVVLRTAGGEPLHDNVGGRGRGPDGELTTGKFTTDDPGWKYVVHFSALTPGRWNLEVVADGYRPIQASVDLKSGTAHRAFATLYRVGE